MVRWISGQLRPSETRPGARQWVPRCSDICAVVGSAEVEDVVWGFGVNTGLESVAEQCGSMWCDRRAGGCECFEKASKRMNVPALCVDVKCYQLY
jgi:hypothetical protein